LVSSFVFKGNLMGKDSDLDYFRQPISLE